MVNKVILQGRMVADPELKKTMSDVSNLEFTVAWSDRYKEIETKCFMRCKAWRGTADFISKYFRKGQEIVIEGKMVTEEWEKDGEKKSRTICVVDGANFCGSKQSNLQSTAVESKPLDDFVSVPEGADEELPFN